MIDIVENSVEILRSVNAPQQLLCERSAFVLLALAGLKPGESWANASNPRLSINGNKKGRGYAGIIPYINKHFDQTYAENTRESIRKTDVRIMIQLGIVEHNADDKSIVTTSSKNHYSLRPEVLPILQQYGEKEYFYLINKYLESNEDRNRRYKAKFDLVAINVPMPNGKILKFSPGDHNELQGRIISSFREYFAPNSDVLYVGDTKNKYLHIRESQLASLGINMSKESKSKLPDVVLHDKNRNWLFFIEAVTSANPIGNKRMHTLEEFSRNVTIGVVYVTAFLEFSTYKKFSQDIAWETEVWIAEDPQHMIHYNGDKFFGPR